MMWIPYTQKVMTFFTKCLTQPCQITMLALSAETDTTSVKLLFHVLYCHTLFHSSVRQQEVRDKLTKQGMSDMQILDTFLI